MILAIETSTPHGSVALVSGETVVAKALLPAGRQASETILSAVDGLFRNAGSESRGVSHVAVSAGPGSFTGLRVGMAAAKGFCFGLGAGIVPVPTLHALALRFPFSGGTVCPVLDAKKNEVYAALFRWEKGGPLRLLPDMAVAPEALPDRVGCGTVLFCGDGAFAFRAFFRERLGESAVFPPEGEGRPDAAAVGLLAARLVRGGASADARTLVPAYLRSSEAELKRRGQEAAGPGRVSHTGASQLTNHGPLIDWETILKPEVPMGQSQEAKKEALLETSTEFKSLVQEHRMLDDKLKEYDRKVYLTPDEEMERKRLQKLKLAKKDQIARMLTSP